MHTKSLIAATPFVILAGALGLIRPAAAGTLEQTASQGSALFDNGGAEALLHQVGDSKSVPAVQAAPVTAAPAPSGAMVPIPAGDFWMGDDGPQSYPEEAPVHKVWLDAYTIDVYPVTNADYAVCVKAGACPLPHQLKSVKRASYYGNPEFDNYPVVYVHWEDADAYCRFVGKQLPTEAQWEKAARGSDGRRLYPWGDAIDPTLANYKGVETDTVEVGHYPGNVSPYGARDMAGNVLQWVRDWFDYDYYADSPSKNPYCAEPVTPASNIKALRGGSVAFEPRLLRVSSRFGLKLAPDNVYGSVGFRCAK